MAEIIPPRRGEFLTPNGVPTTRFIEYLEALTATLNDNSSSIEASQEGDTTKAQLLSLQERIGSGDPLTCDETGFTCDSDRLSVDMDEA